MHARRAQVEAQVHAEQVVARAGADGRGVLERVVGRPARHVQVVVLQQPSVLAVLVPLEQRAQVVVLLGQQELVLVLADLLLHPVRLHLPPHSPLFACKVIKIDQVRHIAR